MKNTNVNAHNIDPQWLADRGEQILSLLLNHGIDPLHDATDLLLVSLLPLAIKRVLLPDPFGDVEMLAEVLVVMDLEGLERLINARRE